MNTAGTTFTLEEVPPELLRPRVEFRVGWYQTAYNLAAHHANAELRRNRDRARHREAALTVGVLAAATASLTLLRLGQTQTWHVSRHRLPLTPRIREHFRLAEFLQETAEPAALVLVGGVARRMTTARRNDELPLALRRDVLAGRREAVLQLLDFVTQRAPTATEAARLLVAEIAEHRRLTYRARYNLACYYAQPPIDLRNSFFYLGRALITAPGRARPALAARIWTDPSLASLVREAPRRLKLLTGPYIPVDEVVRLVTDPRVAEKDDRLRGPDTSDL
jgi:hypothetical protein